MNWLILFLAGILEIGWAMGMKYSEGFTKLVPSAITLVTMAASFILLGFAMKSLPVGTAYAVWTGIGAAGTVICGMIFFGESASFARVLCVLLILSGIVGLKLVSE